MSGSEPSVLQHRNTLVLSSLCVLLGVALGASLGAFITEIDTTYSARTIAYGAGIFGVACTIAVGLFFIATTAIETKENRALVGQLGGPIIGVMAALFAAYLAFGGTQQQIQIQERMLQQSRAPALAASLIALRDLEAKVQVLRGAMNLLTRQRIDLLATTITAEPRSRELATTVLASVERVESELNAVTTALHQGAFAYSIQRRAIDHERNVRIRLTNTRRLAKAILDNTDISAALAAEPIVDGSVGRSVARLRIAIVRTIARLQAEYDEVAGVKGRGDDDEETD